MRQLWFISLLVLPILLLAISSNYFDSLAGDAKPPGQTLFMLVRLSGLYAVYLLAIQISWAFRMPTKNSVFGHKWGRRDHIILGVLCAFVILAHISLFIGAGYLRTGTISLGVFIPKLFQGYYQERIGFGVLSMWLIVATIFAGIFRAKFQFIYWRFLHKSALLAFLLAVLHSVSIGSDTRSPAVIAFYLALILIVSARLIFYLKPNKRP